MLPVALPAKNQKHVDLLNAEEEWFTDDRGHVSVIMKDG